LATVLPIDGGEARYVLKPAPLTVELAESVVNAPVFAAVLPIAGGDARYVLKPAPLTVELAESVVNAPVFGVVAPTVPFTAPPVEVSVVNEPAAVVVWPIGVPSIVPPVTATLFAFCVASVPSPRFVRAPLAVDAFVPPFAIGTSEDPRIAVSAAACVLAPVPPFAMLNGVLKVTVVNVAAAGVVPPITELSIVHKVCATPLSVPLVA
jgi:hypothetical protein